MDKLELWKQMAKKKRMENAQGNSNPVNPIPQNLPTNLVTDILPIVPPPPIVSLVPEIFPSQTVPEKEIESKPQQTEKQKPKLLSLERPKQEIHVQPFGLVEEIKPYNNQKQNSYQHLEVEKPNYNRFFSENVSIAISKPSIDDGNQGEKLRVMKLTRYLLKDVDKLKHAVANIECSIKGLEYIKKRVKNDRKFNKKIKNKINLIRDIFSHDSI